MLRELIVALFLAGSCVFIHAVGIIGQLSWFVRMFQPIQTPNNVRALLALLRLVCILFTLHVLEIMVWGEFYFREHCFADRETAYYFSLTSYTTVGYGDVVISHPWRLMGGLEAINGVLLFGWSTASLVAILLHFRDARLHAVGVINS
jgi:voltage-gated potassium channel